LNLQFHLQSYLHDFLATPGVSQFFIRIGLLVIDAERWVEQVELFIFGFSKEKILGCNCCLQMGKPVLIVCHKTFVQNLLCENLIQKVISWSFAIPNSTTRSKALQPTPCPKLNLNSNSERVRTAEFMHFRLAHVNTLTN